MGDITVPDEQDVLYGPNRNNQRKRFHNYIWCEEEQSFKPECGTARQRDDHEIKWRVVQRLVLGVFYEPCSRCDWSEEPPSSDLVTN